MPSTNEAEQILKIDSRGRVRVSAERREGLLDEFERSGLSGVKFAELTGIKYQTFASWLQRRKRGRPGVDPAPAGRQNDVRWLEGVVEKAAGSEPGGDRLMLQLPGGARVEVGNERQALLAAKIIGHLQGG